MARYSETTSILGARIMKYRKAHNLTQSDLAERYSVSGPAIFKFEKGFVTPSLKLWLKIAANIGIPEKESVLIWVREKLPNNMKDLVSEVPTLDVAALDASLAAAKDDKELRDVLQVNPDISPALKKLVASNEMWGTLKPTRQEILFLVALTQSQEIVCVTQFRDALMVAREIQG